MKKYLIIRFSSIGDIVLTSPVIRCLKKNNPDVILHFLTKKVYSGIVEANPNIDKVYGMEKEIDALIDDLKEENYDFIIDLHKNLRTTRLKSKLKKPSAAFPKLNFKKFLLTTFKVDKMPDIHIVDRYFEAIEKLGVKNDGQGLEYFISEEDHVDMIGHGIKTPFIAFAIGAQLATKRLPKEKIVELISKIDYPIVLLGGKEDVENASFIVSESNNVISLCGVLSLNQSASVLQQAHKVITHDTGLMHIASAFNKPIISIWGNTVPALGMYPYQPKNETNYSIHEVDVKCRPCSKIGYQKCPKGHFKCMMEQDLDRIASKV